MPASLMLADEASAAAGTQPHSVPWPAAKLAGGRPVPIDHRDAACGLRKKRPDASWANDGTRRALHPAHTVSVHQRERGDWITRGGAVREPLRSGRLIVKASSSPLKSVEGLSERPSDRAGCIVAVRQVMVQGGKATLLAFHLHAGKLFLLESRLARRSPVVRRAIHREAGSKRPIGTDDQRILSRAAVPLLQ